MKTADAAAHAARREPSWPERAVEALARGMVPLAVLVGTVGMLSAWGVLAIGWLPGWTEQKDGPIGQLVLVFGVLPIAGLLYLGVEALFEAVITAYPGTPQDPLHVRVARGAARVAVWALLVGALVSVWRLLT